MKNVFINGQPIEVVDSSCMETVASKIHDHDVREDKEDAFYVVDLGDIINKYKLWNNQLPRVEPHYAVKCNDNPVVLGLLAQLGTGFDCASKAEIRKILELNVSPNRIVYANPCKQNSHIRYAAQNGIEMMTFDNETELYKVKKTHPYAKLIIRILPPDDTKAVCPLGIKYGTHPKNVPSLLKVAKELDLDVIGVSFHVGSGCYDAAAYSEAIVSARTVFDMGKDAGFSFDLLDIGGGFPGQKSAPLSFDEICDVLRPSLDDHFPESMGVRIISEPGRFFVASAFTLSTNIIAKRAVPRDINSDSAELTNDDEPAFMYYVNDGVYGSFNCLLYDHAEVDPLLLEGHEDKMTYTSSIWGPTCDGLDCIKETCLLPELEAGDWVIFKDMGAYTACSASNFNGMPIPRCFFTIPGDEIHHIKSTPSIKKMPQNEIHKSQHPRAGPPKQGACIPMDVKFLVDTEMIAATIF